jgi:hypothetical protein
LMEGSIATPRASATAWLNISARLQDYQGTPPAKTDLATDNDRRYRISLLWHFHWTSQKKSLISDGPWSNGPDAGIWVICCVSLAESVHLEVGFSGNGGHCGPPPTVGGTKLLQAWDCRGSIQDLPSLSCTNNDPFTHLASGVGKRAVSVSPKKHAIPMHPRRPTFDNSEINLRI